MKAKYPKVRIYSCHENLSKKSYTTKINGPKLSYKINNEKT